MKRVIIFEHDGGELANQLWNYASVYAYCIERGFACENWSFFEYAKYFANLEPRSVLLRTLFFLPLVGYYKRRGARLATIWRRLYKIVVVFPVRTLARSVCYSRGAPNGIVYLPPTEPASPALALLESRPGRLFVGQVSGGVFRNPVGMAKNGNRIRAHFSPAQWVRERVSDDVTRLRRQYRNIIGVHIRQGDFKNFKGGKFAIKQERVREILEEYLRERGFAAAETCFVIASDGRVDGKLFEGLAIEHQPRTAGEDLFLLAACDAVIGSDSTFGHFAAWYGNVPHIVMSQEPVPWDFYRGKKYFEHHPYLTVALF